MITSCKCIVLNTVRYGDTGLVLHGYTDLYGRLSFIVQGIYKNKPKISPFYFQPLSNLEVIFYYKENNSLQRIKDARPIIQLNNICFNIRHTSIALFIGEILYRAIKETEPNITMFDFFLNSIRILEKLDKKPENFHLVFLIQLTKYLGIYTGIPKNMLGDKVCEYPFIDTMFKLSLEKSDTLNLNSTIRLEVLSKILAYYTTHLDGMESIKSLPVLREVFH